MILFTLLFHREVFSKIHLNLLFPCQQTKLSPLLSATLDLRSTPDQPLLFLSGHPTFLDLPTRALRISIKGSLSDKASSAPRSVQVKRREQLNSILAFSNSFYPHQRSLSVSHTFTLQLSSHISPGERAHGAQTNASGSGLTSKLIDSQSSCAV